MAGFFGLFNYEKEGPGVSKDEPQKRGMFAFFEKYFRYFWQLVTVSFWWFLLSLPLIPTGLASVGMTYVCRSIGRGKHSFGSSDFFSAIKKNWKQSLAAGIINLAVTVLCLISVNFYYSSMMLETKVFSAGTVCLGLILFLLIIFSVMRFYMWTLIVTFSFTLKDVYRNSFRLAFIGLKRNLLIIVCLLPFYAAAAALLLFCGSIGVFIVTFLGVGAFPAFKYLLIQCNIFPVIKKYMIDPYYKLHPGEDIEKRKSLGLDFAEGELDDETDDDETLFEDAGKPQEDE